MTLTEAVPAVLDVKDALSCGASDEKARVRLPPEKPLLAVRTTRRQRAEVPTVLEHMEDSEIHAWLARDVRPIRTEGL